MIPARETPGSLSDTPQVPIMSLTAAAIYLVKSRKLSLPPSAPKAAAHQLKLVATFNRNLEGLGFTMSGPLIASLAAMGHDEIVAIYKETAPVLKAMVGKNREFKPMYPNFPDQVMQASDLELYTNAMMHYTGSHLSDVIGVPVRFLPDYPIDPRKPLDKDEVSLKVIGLGTPQDFEAVFTRLMAANSSLSENDKEVVKWFAEHRLSAPETIARIVPDNVPQKENLAYLLGSFPGGIIPNSLASRLKTATDVLRVAVVLSKGDVSLAAPTKFRRFKRTERRFLLNALEQIESRDEDMHRRPEVWKRLGRELRPGDYKTKFPKAFAAFTVVRNDTPVSTFNSQVEAKLKSDDAVAALELLAARPGELARRLDHLCRKLGPKWHAVVTTFGKVAHKVSTPVLLQTLAHFRSRGTPVGHRTFFPKGSVGKIQVVEDKPLPAFESGLTASIEILVGNTLMERFSKLPPLGKVFVDPRLKTQMVPFAQRSASKTLRSISRGSRVPLPDSNTVRFFIWWKDGTERTDIDLSAVFYDADWKVAGKVSYYNLREFGGCHSGDITSAPNGAAEFIDVQRDKLLAKDCRYVQMVINSYTSQAFKDLPECFAGWMGRRAADSGEVFDARTVQDKIDVTSDTTVCVPLILDLVDNQVIWADIALTSTAAINNVDSNGSRLGQMAKAIATLIKPNLFDLFSMHAEARGTVVATRAEADTVFDLYEGITPFDTDKILAEFMPNEVE